MNTEYTSNIEIDSKYSAGDFAVDGNLAKPIWRRAKWIRFDHDLSGSPRYPQAQTRVASAWTAARVAFAFWCKYTSLNFYAGENPAKERWGLWERDVVEVFLNPLPARVSHYYEFEVAPNNQWIDLEIDKTKTPFNDAGWNSGFEHAARVDTRTRAWACEMAIPVSSMGVRRITRGEEWRLNLFRADGAGDNLHRRLMAWSTIPEGRSFHTPERFGIIRFVR